MINTNQFRMMRKVFLTITLLAFLAGNLFTQTQQKNGKVTFVTESHDFGSIRESDNAVFVFDFINTGTDPVILKDVKASCRCTTINWPENPIVPGKKGSIKVTYHTANRPGNFEKTITVIYNGNPGSQVLKIKGMVIPKLYIYSKEAVKKGMN
jgi:hypothetical protein